MGLHRRRRPAGGKHPRRDLKFTAPLTAITAAVALLRYKANVIHVIAGCALAGLVVQPLVGV